MKNILVIDSADNCAYDIYACSDQDFWRLFPDVRGDMSDVAFSDEFDYGGAQEAERNLWSRLWSNPVPKPLVHGLHGVIFYGFPERKKFYLNRQDRDLDGWARHWSCDDAADEIRFNPGWAQPTSAPAKQGSERRNIMVIDSGVACAFDVYSCDAAVFDLLFPNGADIAFGDELDRDAIDKMSPSAWSSIWLNPVLKPRVEGVHGLLFFDLPGKKRFYPNRSERDLDGWARPWSLVDGRVVLNRAAGER